MEWMGYRLEESRGFVSRRIMFRILNAHVIIFGTSCFKHYGPFVRIFSPLEVFTKPPSCH